MLASATPHLWSGKLIGAMAITFIVQGVTIAAYAARLAGVQTKRIATSISLFNLFVTTGRLANLFMLLFVGPLSDQAGNAVVDVAAWHHVFELQLRLIVLAGTCGMVVFALFLPMFTYLFRRGVQSFEARGSVPHSLLRLASPAVIRGRAPLGAVAEAGYAALLPLAARAQAVADFQYGRHVRLRNRRAGFVSCVGPRSASSCVRRSVFPESSTGSAPLPSRSSSTRRHR